MSSTANLGIIKPLSEQDAQKVVTYNTAVDNLDLSVAGNLSLSVAGSSDVTLTNQASGTPGTQALNKTYTFTGVLTGNINVKFPATGGSSRQFVVFNNTTGAFTLTVKTTAGGSTGIAVTQGKKRLLWTDGTNVYDSITEGGGSITGAASDLSNLTGPTAINTGLILGSDDGGALGSSSKGWSDLFLASGAVINFVNGDVTITHSTNKLTIAGADSGVSLSPVSAGVVAGGLYIGALPSASLDSGSVSDLLHLQGSDGKQSVVVLDDYGSNPAILARRANNTAASPSATASGDTLLNIIGEGYQTNTNAFTGAVAQIRLVAAEAFTSTAQGTRVGIRTTPVGTISALERLQVTSQGSILLAVQGALATNATDGFTYIPTCAGTPTGVPTTQTGQVAMIYDTTNHKFYIYDGGWKGGTVPGAFS